MTPRTRTRSRAPREVQPGTIGPRKRIGPKEVRKGDLVLVSDPHEARPFVAQMVDAYTVGGLWHIALGPVPHLERRPPRQSTRVTCVKQVWRREGPAWRG